VLIDNVADIIERTGLDAGLLGLEITESVIMRDPEASTTSLRASEVRERREPGRSRRTAIFTPSSFNARNDVVDASGRA